MPAVESTPAPLPVCKPAPRVVGPVDKAPKRPTKKIPSDVISIAQATPAVDFDAKKHIDFVPPKRTYTMAEWGYAGQGISEIAGSDPFPIWTEEAVHQCRRELFSEPVLRNRQYATSFASNMIRGPTQEEAPFLHALWKSTETIKAVSKIAGIELVPAFDTEIASTNLFFDTGDKKDDNVGFAWHYDSFPFVLVTMLSDCTGMVGGETAIRTGNGDILKVRGPTMGTGVVLQGRYIQHAALKAFGKERISMICAFRPKDPFVRDEIVLTGSRVIGDQSAMYYDYLIYRAQVLEARFKGTSIRLSEAQKQGLKFDRDAARKFVNEQIQMLEATLTELEPLEDCIEAS